MSKTTWYQVAYVTLPLNVLITFFLDHAARSTTALAPSLGKWLVNTAAILGALTLITGISSLALFPAASLLQWQSRSHVALEAAVSRSIPSHSRVMTDPGAFFAVLANDCIPYPIPHRVVKTSLMPYLQKEIQRVLREVDYVILLHDGPSLTQIFPPGDSLYGLECTIGGPGSDLPWIHDGHYWFDIYHRKP
jgi:hypothetical protein